MTYHPPFTNRKSQRLNHYDYSKDNLYFVTSCVKDRVCCFGEIVGKKMKLNDHGKIAEKQWFWLGQQYSYVVLHAFTVMPNHIHSIIEIDHNRVIDIVGTGRDLSLQYDPSKRNDPSKKQKIKSLSELMGAYKTTVSKQIHLSGDKHFAWQRSFHDHIIRNHNEYQAISNYINNNPAKWNDDMFFNSDIPTL
ncbi:MAG: transposase [Bacteroidota bacterium]